MLARDVGVLSWFVYGRSRGRDVRVGVLKALGRGSAVLKGVRDVRTAVFRSTLEREDCAVRGLCRVQGEEVICEDLGVRAALDGGCTALLERGHWEVDGVWGREKNNSSL